MAVRFGLLVTLEAQQGKGETLATFWEIHDPTQVGHQGPSWLALADPDDAARARGVPCEPPNARR